MMKNAGFVSVKDAAKILDVAPNTVRAWGARGEIDEYRHPANNYRLYKKSDLEKLVEKALSPISVKKTGKSKK